MKYFEIDGLECRALPYDKDLLGSNRQALTNNNIFVRKLDKNLKASEVEEKFKKVGEVKSVKVSIDEGHHSRGYGFVCF